MLHLVLFFPFNLHVRFLLAVFFFSVFLFFCFSVFLFVLCFLFVFCFFWGFFCFCFFFFFFATWCTSDTLTFPVTFTFSFGFFFCLQPSSCVLLPSLLNGHSPAQLLISLFIVTSIVFLVTRVCRSVVYYPLRHLLV